jgi:hypothetical protein
MDWWMDLLATYTHHSELQVITELSLISTLNKSPQHLVCLFQPAVFISRSLSTASNIGDYSASRAQALFSQPPVQNSFQLSTQLQRDLFPDSLAELNWLVVKVRVRIKVTLRLSVYCQSVRLCAKLLETHKQYFFLQLNTCGCGPYVTSSLTSGCVCHLQLLLAIASAIILGSESRGTTVLVSRLP